MGQKLQTSKLTIKFYGVEELAEAVSNNNSFAMKQQTFNQRFGLPPECIARHAAEIEHKLTTLQFRVAVAWASKPDAGPSQIASEVGITPDSLRSVTRSIRRRLSDDNMKPQGHRALIQKIGAEDLEPDIQAEVMTRLRPAQRRVLQAAIENPGYRTGQIASLLGCRHPAVSGCTQIIRETIAYVKAKGVRQIRRDREWLETKRQQAESPRGRLMTKRKLRRKQKKEPREVTAAREAIDKAITEQAEAEAKAIKRAPKPVRAHRRQVMKTKEHS